jgi:hypothetical protein
MLEQRELLYAGQVSFKAVQWPSVRGRAIPRVHGCVSSSFDRSLGPKIDSAGDLLIVQSGGSLPYCRTRYCPRWYRYKWKFHTAGQWFRILFAAVSGFVKQSAGPRL